MSDVRITPYDLVFGAPGWDADRLDLVAQQAAQAGADSPGALAQLPAAGMLLRELLHDEAGTAHADVFAQLAALLFHCVRFRDAGRTVFRFDEAALRRALGSVPAAGVAAPLPSAYLQLPRNVVWVRAEDDSAAEPADGFFWNATPLRLDLLLVLGLRAGRPGLTLIDVTLEGEHDLGEWARNTARVDGDDFANILPGGELMSYHALTSHAEMIKFAARCFATLSADDAAVPDTHGNRIVHVHG